VRTKVWRVTDWANLLGTTIEWLQQVALAMKPQNHFHIMTGYLQGGRDCGFFCWHTASWRRVAVRRGDDAVVVGLVWRRSLVQHIPPPGGNGDITDCPVDAHRSRLCRTLAHCTRKPVSYPVGSGVSCLLSGHHTLRAMHNIKNMHVTCSPSKYYIFIKLANTC
jgi:hypothetical protein